MTEPISFLDKAAPTGADEARARLARGRERARDCATLAIGAMAVFIILALSGALGWIEAITACLVVGAGSLAYFVGSTPAPPRPTEPALFGGPASEDLPGIDLASLVDTLPLPALVVSPSGRLSASNRGAQAVFRLMPGSTALAGAALRRPALLGAIENVQATGGRATMEVTSSAETDHVWLAHVSRCSTNGDVLVVLEDRTGVRRAERARADFLANASHELRTPLTSLAGFIETMRGPARDDKASWDRFLDIMYEQTERMRRLIADLLSLSRIEFSEHQAPDQREDLAGLAAREAETFVLVAEERGVAIAVSGPEGPLDVIAIRDELVQIVQNLLSNALKYASANGHVGLSWGVCATMDEARAAAGRQWPQAERMTLLDPPGAASGSGIWLRVEDDGPGIAREHLPRLGERFYRVDESRGGAITGTGLGLAIVKHIMTRHRGGLIVESVPGKGAAFGIWMPAAPQPRQMENPIRSTDPVIRL